MGKSKGNRGSGGKRSKGGAYVHNHTHNPKAHGSMERRVELLKGLEVKRLQNLVNKQREEMQAYHTAEQKALKKQKMDVKYVLKGAARAAQSHYMDPNLKPVPPTVDLFKQHPNRIWDHDEGKVLLRHMYDLGGRLHNMAEKSDRAVRVFEECLVLDKGDRVCARYNLLRIHLDMGEADKARALLERFPDDRSAYFMYARALIEFISVMLNEAGASVASRDAALEAAWRANPYALWVLVFHTYFREAEHLEELPQIPPVGSVLEALSFFYLDTEIWVDTDGALEWVVRRATAMGDGEPPVAKPSCMDWTEVERESREADTAEHGEEENGLVGSMRRSEEAYLLEESKIVESEGKSEWHDEPTGNETKDKSENDDGLSPEQEAENMFLEIYDSAIEAALAAIDADS